MPAAARSATAAAARPVVGVTAYVDRAAWGVWDCEATVLHHTYVNCVVEAGGVPVVLPPYADGAGAVLGRLDALVVAGGPDVDPRHYGERPHPRTGAPAAHRDAAELTLLAGALDRDVPLLAICRGMQLLNVVHGGTLSQHLPDEVRHARHQPRPGMFGRHPVEVAADSRLARALGATDAQVASHHHQGVARVGNGLRAVAWADDGTVEAVEDDRVSFGLGVLWHPEATRDATLFAALTAAARAAPGSEQPHQKVQT